MNKTGKAIRYGSQGAAVGFSFGGPVGAAIGAGAGVLGSLLFGGPDDGPDDEEIRQQRYNSWMDFLGQQKKTALQDTFKLNSGVMARMTAGAKRRAAGAGYTGNDTEAYLIPAQAEAASQATGNINTTKKAFTDAELNARADFENRPIEPNSMDYLMEAGSQGAKYYQDQRYIDMVSGGNKGMIDTMGKKPDALPQPDFARTEGLDGYEAAKKRTEYSFNWLGK